MTFNYIGIILFLKLMEGIKYLWKNERKKEGKEEKKEKKKGKQKIPLKLSGY